MGGRLPGTRPGVYRFDCLTAIVYAVPFNPLLPEIIYSFNFIVFTFFCGG